MEMGVTHIDRVVCVGGEERKGSAVKLRLEACMSSDLIWSWIRLSKLDGGISVRWET